MIFTASLGAVCKKAYPSNSMSTGLDVIMNNLTVDPDISNMDTVVLSMKDFGGFKGKKLSDLVKNKHVKIDVIVFYDKQKDDEFIPDSAIKCFAKKVTSDIVKEELEKLLQTRVETIKESEYVTTSTTIAASKEITDIPDVEEDFKVTNEIVEESYEAKIEEQISNKNILEVPAIERREIEALTATDKIEPSETIEDRIAAINNFTDWGFFKKSLERDAVTRELMNENTQYAGAVNMLEVLDRKIYNVFTSGDKTAEQKFEDIKQLALDRSSHAAVKNNIIVDKVISIMSAITTSVELTVDNKLKEIKVSLDEVKKYQMVFKDRDKINAVVRERLEIQTSLIEVGINLINTFKAMDSSVAEIVGNFEEDLPSSNAYINEVMKPIKNIFTPQNAASLANKIMMSLQANRSTVSLLEGKVEEMIGLIYKLCDVDSTIIDYQKNLIDLLTAQRVEDVIIVDSLIKNCMQLYIGADNSGKTSTILARCGELSRRYNILLVDFSSKSRLKDYSIETIGLREFIDNKIEKQFCCVQGDIALIQDSIDIISEFKKRISYYASIHIIFDEDQLDTLETFAEDAISVHFITNSNKENIQKISDIYKAFNTKNIAKKLVLIDPISDVLRIVKEITDDMLTTKIVTIPYMKEMKECTYNCIPPYSNQVITEVINEAFK